MIREAKLEDIEHLLQMGTEFHKYAIRDKGLGYQPKFFFQYIHMQLRMGMAKILVAEDTGMVVGSIAGVIFPWFMSGELVLSEQWWWVDPDFRGEPHAMELLDSFAEWGKKSGATKLVMVSLGSDNEEAVKRKYRRMGFQYLETHFIKEI